MKISEGLSTREMSKVFNCSQTNIRYWLKKYQLNTSYKYNNSYNCKMCGETNESKMMNKGGGYRSKTICKSCHSKETIKRGNRNRDRLISHLGGKCSRCGYSKCNAALEFHHTTGRKDPNFKSIRYWKFERAIEELTDCLLLCANCHREEHNF